jgi:hypothetical protein
MNRDNEAQRPNSSRQSRTRAQTDAAEVNDYPGANQYQDNLKMNSNTNAGRSKEAAVDKYEEEMNVNSERMKGKTKRHGDVA